jgi:hypothetical protein
MRWRFGIRIMSYFFSYFLIFLEELNNCNFLLYELNFLNVPVFHLIWLNQLIFLLLIVIIRVKNFLQYLIFQWNQLTQLVFVLDILARFFHHWLHQHLFDNFWESIHSLHLPSLYHLLLSKEVLAVNNIVCMSLNLCYEIKDAWFLIQKLFQKFLGSQLLRESNAMTVQNW